MATEVGLRAKLAPEVNERETKKEVGKISDMLKESLSNITPSFDNIRSGLGRVVGRGVGQRLPGRVGTAAGGILGERLAGGSASGDQGGSTVSNLLEEQNDLLREFLEALDAGLGIGGGKGGGGGAAAGGGGIFSRIIGGAGGLGIGGLGSIGGSIGLGGLLQNQLGELSIRELFGIQTSGPMSVANALTGGGAGAALGLGNILFEQIPDIGEKLGLIEDAEKFETRLMDVARNFDTHFSNVVRKASLFWTRDVPDAIRNIEFPDLPNPFRRLMEFLGGSGGKRRVAPNATSMGLSPSDQRLVNLSTRGNRGRTSPEMNVDLSPNIDLGINLDPSGLNDFQRQLEQELMQSGRFIDKIVSAVERELQDGLGFRIQ